jgi:hypothetical protein
VDGKHPDRRSRLGSEFATSRG